MLNYNIAIKNVTISKLTQRQIEVLELIAKAYTNEEIAKILNISEFTVKMHIKAIYRCFDFSYCKNNASVFRLKIALLWLKYRNEICNLEKRDIFIC